MTADEWDAENRLIVWKMQIGMWGPMEWMPAMAKLGPRPAPAAPAKDTGSSCRSRPRDTGLIKQRQQQIIAAARQLIADGVALEPMTAEQSAAAVRKKLGVMPDARGYNARGQPVGAVGRPRADRVRRR
jgi:hypothetical protein